MFRDVMGTLVIFLGINFFLFVSEKLHQRGLFSAETNRKLVHVGVGAFILLGPVLMTHRTGLAILALLFVFVNAYTLFKGQLKGMHSVERETFGTVLYPLSVLIVTLLFWDHLDVFYISLSAMIFGDALAASVGKKYPIRKLGDKSMGGSLAMFFVTFLSAIVFAKLVGSRLSLSELAAISIMAGMFEASTTGGFDNLTVPLGTALYAFHLVSGGDAGTLWLAILVGSLIAVPSYWLEYLTADGAFWTAITAVTVVVFGGWFWLIAILMFFLSSSILTKMLASRSMVKSGEARDSRQVLANGGVPMLVAIANRFLPGFYGIDWLLAYITALAVVNSDTWSTEIGTLNPSDPVNILNFKPMRKGSSGAISPVGTLGGLLGAAFIALLVLFKGYPLSTFTAVTLLGMLGNLIDSLLGATVEARYLCEVCGGIYDVDFHCGQPTKLIGGFPWFGNNMVNFVASLITVLIFMAFSILRS